MMETREACIIAQIKGGGVNRDGVAASGPKEGSYLPLRDHAGRRLHGGNQNWWLNQVEKRPGKGFLAPYRLGRREEAYRLARLGCGVIAMTDLELYLKRRKPPELQAGEEINNAEELTQKDYETYAMQKWRSSYGISKSLLNYYTGLYPWKMVKGLRTFLKNGNFSGSIVKWAPFLTAPMENRRELTLKAIEDMLKEDYPVVFAYHTFTPKRHSLHLYAELKRALMKEKSERGDDEIASHYMTAIGLIRSESDYVLRVESWGRIYYVRYEEYARKLNYFSNILLIEKEKA